MSAKDILKEAFESDSKLYEKTLDDNLDVLKEMVSSISKILIMLFEKGLINENDVEKYFKSNEIDIALENFINKQNKN